MMMRTLPVALYVPNLLCYTRIALSLWGLHYSHSDSNPTLAVSLWVVAALLDLVDGILARALEQTSSLGVVLDICADNVLRSCVWIAVAAAEPSWIVPATMIVCLEWVTMVATQTQQAQQQLHWKEQQQRSRDPPWWVQLFFRNNFCNPLGILGIFGLFGANVLVYASLHNLTHTIPYFQFFLKTAFLGRAVAVCVELWFCKCYVSDLIAKDCTPRR
jgi:phosphatidylglycerophosphate synthase